MREIKFRAWDTEDRKMLDTVEIKDMLDRAYFQGVLSPSKDYDASGFELLQYTGLKDKNGKEIYEGDIVLNDIWDNIPVSIEWDYGAASFCFSNGEYFEEYDETCMTVIGNIYENPELLEVKKGLENP